MEQKHYPTLINNKELMKEWDWEENEKIGLDPNKLTYGNNIKACWLCSKQHSYQASIYKRVKGSGCPICSGHKVLEGYNDLVTTYPSLSKEYNNSKNILKANQISAGSNRKVWWTCSVCGNEWLADVAKRTLMGRGCPRCAKEKHTSFAEQAIYYYIKKVFPDAINGYKDVKNDITELDIYISSINVAIEYDGNQWHKRQDTKRRDNKKNIACKNNGIALYRIKEHLDSSKNKNLIISGNTFLYNRNNVEELNNVVEILLKQVLKIKKCPSINIDRDRQKIYSQYIISKKEKSLAIKNPKLAVEWHPTKNGNITPEMVTSKSHKKAWWLGKCGHSWEAVIANRTVLGNGCPYCSNEKLLIGFNDMATTHPKLAREFDEIKNNIKASEVFAGAAKKFWWRCSLGHSYQATGNSRVINNAGCPYCNGNKATLKGFNDLSTKYPEIIKSWSKNNIVSPDEVRPYSNKKFIFICETCKISFERKCCDAIKGYKNYRKILCSSCGRKLGRQNRMKNKKLSK